MIWGEARNGSGSWLGMMSACFCGIYLRLIEFEIATYEA